MENTSGFQIFDDVSSKDRTWAQFREIVESEGWKSDDHSVMELTPILCSTHSVVAKDEGKLLIKTKYRILRRKLCGLGCLERVR